MLNVTNPVDKDKSRWPKDNIRRPKGNTPETVTLPGLCLTATTWGRLDRPSSFADTVCAACTLAAAWLAGLPRRAGRMLFAVNDAEAGWRGWQVTETFGGLGRRYRDARFEALKTDPTLRRDPLDDRTGQPGAVRQADGWDDVHGWPGNGES
jgi:hypothetical protein